MTLGNIIKEYRSTHGLSMDAFSDKSGISKAYISLLEKNKHPKTGKTISPSIQCIKQAAQGMNVDFNELFAKIDKDVSLINYEDEASANINQIKKEYTNSRDSLTATERRLLAYFSALSNIGKKKALDNIEDLSKIYSLESPMLNIVHPRTEIEKEDIL